MRSVSQIAPSLHRSIAPNHAPDQCKVIDQSRRPEPAPKGRSDRIHRYKITKGKFRNLAISDPPISTSRGAVIVVRSGIANWPMPPWQIVPSVGGAICVMQVAMIQD